MKALFFLYDGYVDWEISPLAYIFSETDVTIETAGHTEEIRHSGQFVIRVDHNVNNCDVDDYDMLVIPGGDPEPLIGDEALRTLIRSFHDKNKRIAAICGASALLGMSGVLEDREYSTSLESEEFPDYLPEVGRSKTDVTVSGNVITAEGNAYIEFAVAVAKEAGLFRDREDELETVLFFKNQLRA
ncbi:UNVERIFIED_CONTAM: DJ-1/PfpI family protein [Halobacillus marinus]